MIRYVVLFSILAVCIWSIGCGSVSVNVPESYGHSRPKVDSSKLPRTADHPDCRNRLQEAYQHIRRLENKIDDLEKDKDELKQDKKQLKREIKHLEKRLDRYED